jgi:Insect cuticle protein
LSALVALSAAQGYNRDPKHAAIISEQRYLSGNGQFGAAYEQEDGTNFKEETDVDGNRRGSYSYVDPDGQKRTVNYVAGKNG